MHFKTILWKYAPRQDGNCPVKIRVTINRKPKYYIVDGISVLPADFDERQGYVKNSHPLAKIYNARIRSFRNQVEEHFLEGGTFETWAITEEEAAERQSFLSFTEQFIEEAGKGQHGLKPGTIRNYRATLKRLREYCEDEGLDTLSFEDIDKSFEVNFRTYLMDRNICQLPGVGKHLKNIKRLMKVSQDRNLHHQEAYKGFQGNKDSAIDKIYLFPSEIELLESLDLCNQPRLECERDRFLVAYYFLMRFSDVCAINRENIFYKNDKPYLRYSSQKTGIKITLPVKPRALELLEKYGYRLNFSSNVQANRELKTICALAGINQITTQGGQTHPKSQLVTTHTARRSAATNMYLEGASIKTIAALGGWKDLRILQRYLLASGIETAELAEGMDFFK